MASINEKIVPTEEAEIEDSLSTTVPGIGKVKTWKGLRGHECKFLVISVINMIAAFAVTIHRLVELEKDTPLYTFAIILSINLGFCLFYAVHGVFRERKYEVYAYIVGILVVLVYILIDLIFNGKRTIPKWVRFAVMLVLAPASIYYGMKIASLTYLAFKTVGTKDKPIEMYQAAGRYSCVLEFDFQVASSLALFGIMNMTHLDPQDYFAVYFCIPFQFFWSVFGWCAMRRESMKLVKIFVLFSVVEPAYLIYRIVKAVKDWNENVSDVLFYSFLGAAILAFVVRVLLLVALKFVVNYFGQGFKETVFGSSVTRNQTLRVEFPSLVNHLDDDNYNSMESGNANFNNALARSRETLDAT